MTFEAAMIGFVIPSMTIDSIRKVQIVLNQALIGHSLPDSRLSRNMIKENNEKKNEIEKDRFSANKYLHVSHYIAKHLNWLPEATFILNYVDPYPHVEYQPVLKSNNDSISSKNDGNSVRNRSGRKNNNSIDSSSHAIIPIDQNGKILDNNDGNSGSYNSSNMSLASIFAKLSFATALIYIGTLHLIYKQD